MSICRFFRGLFAPHLLSLAALSVVGCSSGGADLYPRQDGGAVGTDGCKAPLLACEGTCVDPQLDPEHCGARGDCQNKNAGARCQPVTGRCAAGVTQLCQSGICINDCPRDKKTFAFTGQVEHFTLPSCVVEISVQAWGARGGGQGGLGATVQGTFCVPPGSMLTIVVGEQPPKGIYPSGGGGGSFVALGDTPLFVAGGGGGGYQTDVGGPALKLASAGTGAGGQTYRDGGGGGGFTGDGKGTTGSGGHSFLSGAAFGVQFPAGNTNATRGGFGGGGGASQSVTFCAGGGGGFDGGNAGNASSSTGGTSFVSPNAMATGFTGNMRTGHGAVEVSY